MREVQFGVRVPNSGPLTSIENIVDAAKRSEDMGFDAIWVHDHVVWSNEMHRHHISSGAHEALEDDQTADFYESMTTLGYLAAETKSIQMGVACLVMPCRNPIFAAKQIATVDWLSEGGRLLIGVGLGSKATRESNEFEVFGVPMNKRASMTDEYIQAMKAIWTEPLASYEGRHIKFEDAEIYPKPKTDPHPPVWVGGWTDYAAVRAGKYGEGWIPGWLSPSEMARGCKILEETAAEHGRDGSQITIGVEKLATISRSRDEAMTRALPTIRTSSESYERDVDDIQFALDRHIFGSVEDVRRRVDEFVEAGVRHFELKLIYASMDELYEQMELWAQEIMPAYN
jgi:probable F420-dependent oxidoreductase